MITSTTDYLPIRGPSAKSCRSQNEHCRLDPNRAPRYELEDFRAHALGFYSSARGPVSFGLFRRAFLPLPPRAAVGDAGSWVHLLIDGQCEHQRRRPQFHSQPFLPFEDAESPFRRHPIRRLLLFTDLLLAFSASPNPSPVVFRRPTTTPCICSITREIQIGRMRAATPLIGCRFTVTAMTAKRKIPGATSFSVFSATMSARFERNWASVTMAICSGATSSWRGLR